MGRDTNEDYLLGNSTPESCPTKAKARREINFDRPDQEPASPLKRPDNHLIKALIALYLFPIIGIFAVYKSWRVHELYNKGDNEGAKMASQDADLFAKVGIGIVVVPILLIVAAIIGYLIYLCFILFIYYE